MEDNFDSILTKLGTGKWNLFYVITIAYWYSVLPYHAIAGVFMVPPVAHTCRPPPHALTNTNITYFTFNNHTQESCSYLVEDAKTGQVAEEPCTEWDFDNSTFTHTVTSEFQLVCEHKYQRATYQSMYMMGMLVGAAFNSFLVDRYGRWTTIAVSTVSYTVIALVITWLPSISTLLIARFILGMNQPPSLHTGYILTLEVLETKKRGNIAIIQFITWPLGTALFGAWAYLIRDWRWLQLAVSLPCIIFLPALWYLGESPRWLVVVGQHQRALKELKRAARWNKATLPPDHELLNMMKAIQKQSTTAKEAPSTKNTMASKIKTAIGLFTILFRTPRLRLVTMSMMAVYFVSAMLFFGLTLAGSTIEMDVFLYVGIMGLSEVPSHTILVPFVAYFGRKKSCIINFALTAIALLIQPFVPTDPMWLPLLLAMVGKVAITSAFTVAFLYTVELFPTEVRGQGASMAMLTSRMGAIIAPYIISALDTKYPWAISVVFGVFAVVAALAMLPLWETMNTKLPDTITELESHRPESDKAGLDTNRDEKSKHPSDHLLMEERKEAAGKIQEP